MKNNYLQSARKEFEYYKSLGNKTFRQLDDEQLHWQFNESTNSVAMIVNHLWGNMLSRWTDFLHSDGEKSWRNREQEFEKIIRTREEMLQKWEEGWATLFDALDSLNEENFNTKIFIRNQEHTVIEAINRQLTHYAYHVGQIVFTGKMLKDDAWQSLSIPKGKSKAFNTEKFSRGQHSGHFSDDLKN